MEGPKVLRLPPVSEPQTIQPPDQCQDIQTMPAFEFQPAEDVISLRPEGVAIGAERDARVIRRLARLPPSSPV